MKDNLGDRIKENYENRAKIKLLRRTPVIIRLDGKAFHTFTKGFNKPFDEILTLTMQKTMLALCKLIQGCVLGYTQSDEITLVLTDYAKLNTSAWFDYDIQKICSVSASIATLIFHKTFFTTLHQNSDNVENMMLGVHYKAWLKGAFFDARCFNIPKEEVTNCILWRQQDAIRNSINTVGQAYFSHKELQGLSTDQILKKLIEEKQIDWNKLPVHLQRGSCCIKREVNGIDSWFIDTEIPIFKGDDRNYIEKLI